MAKWLNLALVCLAGSAGSSLLAQSAPTLPPEQYLADPLLAGFRTPPASARPWVWWHWLNGNIDERGAKLDLEWMKRAGVGGVQLFEGNLMTPELVAERRVYMSPEWKRILRSVIARAHDLKLDMAIASSPGWSATGGPWVTPEAAMKKLVWSELNVGGGRRIAGALPQPPSVAGPYQDVPIGMIEPGEKGPTHYRDVAVIASRSFADDLPAASLSVSSGTVSAALLSDRRFASTLDLPFDRGNRTAWVQQTFAAPVKIRSVIVGLPGARGFAAPRPPMLRLEASDDGIAFRKVVDMPASRSPVRSASFSSVTARHFRIVLSPELGLSEGPPTAPGVILPRFGPPPANRYTISEFRLSTEPHVHRAEEKAGFATVADYYALSTPGAAPDRPLAPGAVVDLTSRLRSDGTLDWTPPPGKWRILRFGYSLTGQHNGPAPREATGLEVDKLSARHVSGYIQNYLRMYRDAVGPGLIGSRGINALLSDSIESGPQNWTESMPAEFRKRRGYDLIPWLPVLTGVIVGSASTSDRFLWDFRRTIAELIAENHYAVLARTARENGMTYYAEALEDHRPQLGDDMEIRRHADVPMGAMWMIPKGGEPNPTYVADLQGAASVAHVYGKDLVAAEAFTAFGNPFGFSPRDLKPTADLLFCLGVTRPIIHTSAHQPFADGRAPGMALAVVLGQYFSRNETWAEKARGWTDYLARTAFLLQQGRPHADIAYFYGEEAPITGLYGDQAPADVPVGYAFDFIGADALLSRLSVDQGDLVTPNGSRYAVLVLGGSSKHMTLSVLRKLEQLIDAGATVAGPRPQASPSLADDDGEVRMLAESLWSSGKIYTSGEVALASRGLQPDWTIRGGDARLLLLHRRLPDGDIYFVSNRRNLPATMELDLRVAGKAAEFWRADQATVEPLSYRIAEGRTRVSLTLEANEAGFVVLRAPANQAARQIPKEQLRLLRTLDGLWTLAFQPGRGAPQVARNVSLGSWSQSSEPAIRYFSGTGTYTRRIRVPRTWLRRGRRILLDLGEVHDIADLTINGRKIGQSWKPPYRLDITGYLKPGRNAVSIEVTNLWVNRLIGDAQPAAAKVTFTQAPAYAADAPLRSSGLLGPITIWAGEGRR